MKTKPKNNDISINYIAMCIKNARAGITLVALVITIIVLLILAGVAVGSLTGDNGIFKKAQEAKDKTTQGEKTEQELLNSLSESINQIQGENTGEPTMPSTPAGTPLPDGFVYVGGTIAEGVIISDNTADEGKGITHSVAQTLQGNQFVWIPVETPVANSEEELTALLEEGKLPMAVKQSDGNYRGVLYDIDASGKFTAKNHTLNTGDREPDVVTGNSTGNGTSYDATVANLVKIGVSDLESLKSLLKGEYKKIIESVVANKGFYVGRYETSVTVDGKAECKAGKNASSGDTWYSVYAKSKQLSSNLSSITTGMIWGSQWHQMMIYMKDVKNIKNNAKLFITDSTGMGNYASSPVKTGTNASYNIKGVYDIAGNYWEWTMEANNANARILRGGSYGISGADNPTSKIGSNSPNNTYGSYGCRLTLCI